MYTDEEVLVDLISYGFGTSGGGGAGIYHGIGSGGGGGGAVIYHGIGSGGGGGGDVEYHHGGGGGGDDEYHHGGGGGGDDNHHGDGGGEFITTGIGGGIIKGDGTNGGRGE
jgi:hypothetical protein